MVKPIIRPRTLSEKDIERIGNKKIALHIHAYYPELLQEIINATKLNSIKPDLFISCRQYGRQQDQSDDAEE